MATETEKIIFQKLDAINEKVNEFNLTLTQYMAGAVDCKKKCKRSHDALFGNGTVGIRAKVWVLWGLLGGAWAAIVTIIKVWAGQSGN